MRWFGCAVLSMPQVEFHSCTTGDSKTRRNAPGASGRSWSSPVSVSKPIRLPARLQHASIGWSRCHDLCQKQRISGRVLPLEPLLLHYTSTALAESPITRLLVCFSACLGTLPLHAGQNNRVAVPVLSKNSNEARSTPRTKAAKSRIIPTQRRVRCRLRF